MLIGAMEHVHKQARFRGCYRACEPAAWYTLKYGLFSVTTWPWKQLLYACPRPHEQTWIVVDQV